MNSDEVIFQVNIERTSVATAVVLVKVHSIVDACEAARSAAPDATFTTERVQYIAGEVKIRRGIALPPCSLLDAYRSYVAKCAGDENFDITALECFSDWHHHAVTSELIRFVNLHIGPSAQEALDEVVHDSFGQIASGVNNEGPQSQVEALYGNHGWDETRKILVEAVSEAADWPDSDEDDVEDTTDEYDDEYGDEYED